MSKVPDPKHHEKMGRPEFPVVGIPGVRYHLKLYGTGQYKVERKGRGYPVSPVDFDAWLHEQFEKGRTEHE